MPSIRRRCFLSAVVGCILPVSGAMAQSITCDEPYIVQPGDTLQRIAVRAYGPDASFRDLVEVNLHRFVGGDPSRIEIGQAIDVPCPPPAPIPGPALLRIGPALDGGFVDDQTALLEGLALPEDEAASPVTVGALLDTLDGAPGPRIAGLIPRPACEEDDLPDTTMALCSALQWSVPLEEVVIATFTLESIGPVTRDAAFAESAVCVAETVPAYLLQARTLPTPAMGGAGTDTAACFTALRAGAIDAVVAPAPEADATVAAFGPGASAVEQFALAQLVTLHAVALREDAAATALIDKLDAMVEAQRAGSATTISNATE